MSIAIADVAMLGVLFTKATLRLTNGEAAAGTEALRYVRLEASRRTCLRSCLLRRPRRGTSGPSNSHWFYFRLPCNDVLPRSWCCARDRVPQVRRTLRRWSAEDDAGVHAVQQVRDAHMSYRTAVFKDDYRRITINVGVGKSTIRTILPTLPRFH